MKPGNTQYMQRAIELAALNIRELKGGPFGAVVVRNGEIVSEAYNTVVADNDPSAHAEINAIRKACEKLGTYQLDDCEIYCSCEPCPMCLGAIYWARFEKVYFAAGRFDAAEAGFDDPDIYDEVTREPEARSVDMKQILREEARAVMNTWKEVNPDIEY